MKSKRLIQKSLPLILVLIMTSSLCIAQEYAYEKGEVAVGGYDITSYFEDELIKGKKEFQTEYEGVVYLFANQSNLSQFSSEPEKYIPAYGGWCAMALCQGKLVQPNPKLYSIIDDKLHLFEVKVFYNGKAEWFKNPEENGQIANSKYQDAINIKN